MFSKETRVLIMFGMIAAAIVLFIMSLPLWALITLLCLFIVSACAKIFFEECIHEHDKDKK